MGRRTGWRWDQRIKAIVDAENQVMNFTSNLDDGRAGMSYTNAEIPTPSVSYTYDPQRGRLTGMTDGTGSTSYTYYPLGVLGADNVQTIQGRCQTPRSPSATISLDGVNSRRSTALPKRSSVMHWAASLRLRTRWALSPTNMTGFRGG